MTGCGTERYADWFFDLDGTLVDSAPRYPAAARRRAAGGRARRARTGQGAHRAASGRHHPRDLPGSGPCGSGAHRPHLPGATAPAPLTKARRSPAYRRCSSGCRGGLPVVCGYQQAGGRNPPSARRPGSSAVSGRVRVQRLAARGGGSQGRDAGPAHGTPRRGAGDGDYGRGTRRSTCGEGRRRAWPRLRSCTGMGGAGRCSKPGLISSLRMRRGRAWSGCPAEPPVCMKEGLHEAGKSASGHSLCRDAARVRFHRIAG